MAVQTEALEVVDEVIARRDGGEQVADPGGPLFPGIVKFIGHAAGG